MFPKASELFKRFYKHIQLLRDVNAKETLFALRFVEGGRCFNDSFMSPNECALSAVDIFAMGIILFIFLKAARELLSEAKNSGKLAINQKISLGNKFISSNASAQVVLP